MQTMVLFVIILYLNILMLTSHISNKFPKEKIPTLEEVVELCSSLGLKMIIEIKKDTKAHEVNMKFIAFW